MTSTPPHTTLLIEAEGYVVNLLAEHLSVYHRYHHLNHTLDVRKAAQTLAEKAGMSEGDWEMLELAALFHDTGFVKHYEHHEDSSIEIAEAFLKERNYPEDRIAQVKEAIEATKSGVIPGTTLGEYLCDADLSHLSRTDYQDISAGLKAEWEYFRDNSWTKREWKEGNIGFLKAHQYYTSAARELYNEGKKQNLKLLEESVARKKKEKKKKKNTSALQASRTAQMIFKTASRNHIDLATLADNKANILLSVNTLIITVVVPLSVRQMTSSEFYLVPALLVLVITSLISMIFATQATRPIKTMGSTSMEQVKTRKSNLFFFGNFYKMSFEDYDRGMDEVVSSEEALEASIRRDLFFLGKSLGVKYFQLRVCYTVFMIGIILTVVVFVISYSFFRDAVPGPFLERLFPG